ncbi:isoleucine--tRNA ligase [Candidatus Woesearchaeota archaeon CG10_big_fil_rev_8_21_14_0_10_45_16]|nr:MAG: isoleucine--tRNA ligase [Candidatus Woesearchaeota archaeon CG10_big_fil_rev_8_21_14_0_10_45_16]
MKFPTYNHTELEPEILTYWKRHQITEILREKNKDKQKFYFLEGPPYTSGHIHLGHAWNMALKDIILRYKRMQGFNVWDRMGYDMHGLPTEQKVMAKLNLKNKDEIIKFGLKNFMHECYKFCTEMMHKMDEDFARLGTTLDHTDPYQPIKKEFMEAEWWLIKQAYEKGRLYQGLRTMHWDAATQTAVAKHELEYKRVTDTSIYVKLKLKDEQDTFFVIWTTTPWTIPLNLAVMVNPDLSYVKVQVGTERWILAKSLAKQVMEKAGYDDLKILEEFNGKDLEGKRYIHPLDVKQFLPKELQENPKLFSVLLSSEYVDDSAGTGLVHAAPGCGPEDYEVGHRNGLQPFNCVNEEGFFENFGSFDGWKAKTDDKKFIQAIDDAEALIAKEPYIHDYPHGERSHEPVIFRTTKQWFFKVEDLKEKMIEANEDIYWNPQAGKNAFRSWLENLRDNSITKQRYWGTPVPIWQADDGDFLVIGSIKELEELSGKKIGEMHIPDIDEITIEKDGKIYKRVPDVLDVWIDAGTVSWNCLDYPNNQELLEKLFPADFILEGKDQIRGWFNLLMVASALAFDKPMSFKNVFMHGFVTDVSGVKMSKSLGNIISPYELIEKHGADVLRYYMCQTNAGEDINFTWEECVVKERQLHILWNVHKLLLTLTKDHKINPFTLDKSLIHNVLDVEEKYIFSKLHQTILKVTELLENYRIDEIITPIEDLFLELSRTYIQMVRDKSGSEDDQEKEVVTYTIATVLLDCLKMLSLISPFISEAMYLNLKEAFNLKEESISHCSWPKADHEMVDENLLQQMKTAQEIIQAALNTREKAKLGLRWPVKEVIVVSKDKSVVESASALHEVISRQVNCKAFTVLEDLSAVKKKIRPEYSKIGPAYGPLSTEIITKLTIISPETVLENFEKNGSYKFIVKEKEVEVTPDMVKIERIVPEKYKESECRNALVYLDTDRNAELEAEGFARELMRNVQNLRKKAGLQKTDEIHLIVKVDEEMLGMLEQFSVEIRDKVGADKLDLIVVDPVRKHQFEEEFLVKGKMFWILFDKV